MTLKNLHTGEKSQTRYYGLNNEPSPIFTSIFTQKSPFLARINLNYVTTRRLPRVLAALEHF